MNVKNLGRGLVVWILLLCDGLAHNGTHAHEKMSTELLSIVKGERVVIDVLRLCLQQVEGCEADYLQVKTNPTEGVLFEDQPNGRWVYQHAGTSSGQDRFEVSLNKGGKRLHEFTVVIDIDASHPEIVILKPSEGSSHSGGTILVSYTTIGKGFDHIHLQINGEAHVSLYTKEGQYEFTGLEPGNHIISATLARSDHRAILNSRKLLEVQVLD